MNVLNMSLIVTSLTVKGRNRFWNQVKWKLFSAGGNVVAQHGKEH